MIFDEHDQRADADAEIPSGNQKATIASYHKKATKMTAR